MKNQSKKKKPSQKNMFGGGKLVASDMPLFSQTAQTAKAQEFNPEVIPDNQLGFEAMLQETRVKCTACKDTGYAVGAKKKLVRCICGAGRS